MPEMNAPVPGAAPPDTAMQQPADAPAAPMGPPEQATPEEQSQYDQIVANAMKLVYDDKTMPAVVEMLAGDGDPIEGLARTAAMVIGRVTESAAQAGVPLDAVVAFHAGTEIFEDLADLSKEADIKDFTQSPDDLEAAYFRALDLSRKMLQDSGRLTPEAADADMQKLSEMDASGQLEQVLMGLAERDAGGAATEPQQRGLMPEAA